MLKSTNILIVLMLAIGISAMKAQDYAFTIDECMEYAMQNNQDVIDAYLGVSHD